MTNNYTIRGIALHFDTTSCHQRPFRLRAGALRTIQPVELHFGRVVNRQGTVAKVASAAEAHGA